MSVDIVFICMFLVAISFVVQWITEAVNYFFGSVKIVDKINTVILLLSLIIRLVSIIYILIFVVIKYIDYFSR